MGTVPPHPFDPLTPEEISRASKVARPHFGGQQPNFRVVTLLEPSKKQMIQYLENEHQNKPIEETPVRYARIEVVVQGNRGENQLFELIVDLDSDKVVQKQHHQGKHSYIDSDYMQAVEKACLADENVQAEIKTLNLPPEATVVVEAWAYATDGTNDMTERLTMCWFYMRLLESADANYYAYPLDVCAEVSESLQVVKIYRLPTKPSERINQEKKEYDRRKMHPAETSEYHPDLRPSPRRTTKPYQVVQPDGPSFQIEGNHVQWEKWSFRVGFNYREGLTLHDIRYDERSLFYRLSLSEMFVPYGDPRAPYPRKAAFDLGNDGAGINANNLQLGCDCLGTIKYFDAYHNTPDGEPMKMPNVVCCHEQDDGILWKHTNFRTKNPVVARSRILVLQTIITVSNYEYIFTWHFGQDASIFYEIRATGILSTVPTDMEVNEKIPYGTVVAPGVLAPYHQHLFSLRIDPAIDGFSNSLVIEESAALPIDDPSVHNPFGIGYITKQRIIEEEGGFDLDFNTNRTFKFVNESKINPITGTPVGFKLMPFYSQKLLSHPTSFHAKRSEFGNHAVWVTRHQDGDHFPAGKYTMQSMGGDGLASAIAKRKDAKTAESIRDQDIVIWHTFGSTHNPRIEDWPVMPSEKLTVGLKPVNFFSGNPGLDVAPSTQESNKSVLYVEKGERGDCCKPTL
ncbi:hypothetical protein NLG97_g268 [Lecanicillium saksenae]|uniref:Uncharacterized protein n=1 Tax=Lecanicillium saksenae TaxID=468837 RepID=A0ACC1RB74_9HYPO|nr:hypothetical protein NLG97_g268 [Lecanicillium saksenae]